MAPDAESELAAEPLRRPKSSDPAPQRRASIGRAVEPSRSGLAQVDGAGDAGPSTVDRRLTEQLHQQQQQQQQLIAPPLQPTWSGASHLSTDDALLPSFARRPEPASRVSDDRRPSWASSSPPAAVPAGPTAAAPSDRLIRDEVAPFQILSRDLAAFRPDGRLALGAGDGFTERELVRQMPDVWRREKGSGGSAELSTAAAEADSPAGPRRLSSPSRSPAAQSNVLSETTTTTTTGIPLGATSPPSPPSVPGSPDWSAAAERALAHQRAEDERKRLERQRELLDIARHGWELDDHLTPAEERPPPAPAGWERGMGLPAVPAPAGTAQSTPASRVVGSKTSGSLGPIATAAVDRPATILHAADGERSTASWPTESTSSQSGSRASAHAPAGAPTVSDEQEARRRRREESARRQRALSTGSALNGAGGGRRSVLGPASGSGAGAASPSSKAGSAPSTALATAATVAAAEVAESQSMAPPPAPTPMASTAVASNTRRASPGGGGGRPSAGSLAASNGDQRPEVGSSTSAGAGAERPRGGSTGSIDRRRRTSLQATTTGSSAPADSARRPPAASPSSSMMTPAAAAAAAAAGSAAVGEASREQEANESSSVRLSLYGEDAVPPMAADKPTRDELLNWDSVVLPSPSLVACSRRQGHPPPRPPSEGC